MKGILKIIGTAFGIVLLIPLTLLAVYILERAFGFYPGWHFLDVAQIAAGEGNVNICNKIIRAPWLTVMGPSIADRQISCIHEYAKLTKDPSACELLMPSSYGLDCVGGAEDSRLPCGLGKYSVWIGEGKDSREIPLVKCMGVKANDSAELAQCCTVARNAFLLHENDCSTLVSNTPVHDSCLYWLAWKNKDENMCNEIQNANAKSACLVQSKALRKDPSICQGCTKAVESLSDLK